MEDLTIALHISLLLNGVFLGVLGTLAHKHRSSDVPVEVDPGAIIYKDGKFRYVSELLDD
jgi:hypothetical protein